MITKNLDQKTVDSFGDEWSRFDQTGMGDIEAQKAFDEYFAVFPWSELPPDAEGFDMGCGSGRWAKFVAPRVWRLNCVDPSVAINVAKARLTEYDNIEYHHASLDSSKLLLGSQDFGYSLGVLHHVPDTKSAIRCCVDLLKPGAPLLLYLYYSFENRPSWFRALWKLSDFGRRIIFRFPPRLKAIITDLIAAVVYWPIARFCGLLECIRISVESIPLSYYRKHSFYTMRTDARDRFGTPLEKRFTRKQIELMMQEAGLVDIRFSDAAPYWCVVGKKG